MMINEQNSRLYAHYLSGIITAEQYHEASNIRDFKVFSMVQRYDKEMEILSDLLQNINYIDRTIIDQQVIDRIKNRIQTLSRMINEIDPDTYRDPAVRFH